MSPRHEALTALCCSMMGWRPWHEPTPGTPIWGDYTSIALSGEGKPWYWHQDKIAFVWRVADAAPTAENALRPWTWLDDVRVMVLSRGVPA